MSFGSRSKRIFNEFVQAFAAALKAKAVKVEDEAGSPDEPPEASVASG